MSPTVLQVGSYSFRFYSSDQDERRHVHVYAGKKKAKFWLQPVALAWNRGFRSHQLSEIERHIKDHIDYFVEAWDSFFGESGNG